MYGNLLGYKMSRRIGGVQEFVFEPLSEARHLHITVVVTGWIANKDESSDYILSSICVSLSVLSLDNFLTPWKALDHSPEQYSLRWESE